ncbi:MAG: choline dehydrogenase, partial [Solirubrobacteraceae bacterium]|nr:choline dehydrogenase [Solirubrobacteraceae bacterium]
MYDYVIVGAGSAGCVLAARLTEDPDVSVLVLESGPPDTNQNIHVPLGYLQLGRTEIDWDLATAPEPFCDNRRIPLPRGRVLGGSSSMNAMVYIRGNRADYDGWGIPGWSYDDLLPYFIKAEDNERGASEFHGAGGPLPVSDSRSRNPMAVAFAEAGVEAGFPANDDFNGATQDGFGLYQVTQRNGMRASAAVAYLHPAMERPNLTVMPYMHVHRVLFEGTRAVGVAAAQLGQVNEFRAEREVILCGGTYNSPQLLTASGIGRGEELTALQIPIVAELPGVGMNLQEHANVWLRWDTDEPVTLFGALTEENMALFEQGTGPLTSNAAETGGFARTSADLAAPDMQFHMFPGPFEEDGPASAHGFAACVC